MAAAPSLLKLGDEFLTWAEFKAALDNFQETTHAELSKITSKKVETENRKLPEGVQKFPCAHVYRAVKFGCIHYGKPRLTGSGIRTNQSTFKMGCPAEIYVSSDRKKGTLVVTRFNDNHNHEVSEEVRKYYPSQRRLEGELLEEACKLTKLRVDVRVLKDHIHKTSGKLTTSKDLHNLRASLQQGTEADAVIRALDSPAISPSPLAMSANRTSPITTHILDTSLGRPAADVPIKLYRRAERIGQEWSQVSSGQTNSDGRCNGLLNSLEAGVYKITFETATYFNKNGIRQYFYPYVDIVFEIHDPNQHYHVPLLLNPFGYSTYRGS